MKYRILAIFSCVVIMAGLLTGPAAGSTPATSGLNSQPALSAQAPAATPNIISIPLTTNTPPTQDGVCDKNEYAGALSLPFSDGPVGSSGTIQVLHDDKNLYVCMTGPVGTNPARFGALYLDPQGNGISTTYAQKDDYSLKVEFNGSTRTSLQGSGVGQNPASYLVDTAIDNFWFGAAGTGNLDQVEYKVSLADFNLNACNIFGLAVYHHWVSGTGIDFGWPSNQWFDQPRTWQLATLGGSTCGNASGTIAYVFRGNTLDATSYYNLLAAAGYTVTLVPLSDVLATDFTSFDLTMIADDTGSLDTWGTTAPVSLTSAQVSQITAGSGKKPNGTPILGLGEGGYAFFGRLSMYIGWPRGWHGPQDSIYHAAGAPGAFYNAVITPDPIPLYSAPSNSVGIYVLPAPVPADVVPVAMEAPLDDHASLITQNCRMLWGNSANPLSMTGDGQTIFLNSVDYVRNAQCPPPPSTVPPECLNLVKSANPAAPGPVIPGATITYTLTRTIPVGVTCPAGKLVDSIPFGTTFIPGSATHGSVPDAAGTLTWVLNTAAGVQSESFSVNVADIACAANKSVANYGELRLSGSPPQVSNKVSHTITCQPVGFPNSQPEFAETELKIEPYPLTAGVLSHASVRVTNLTTSPALPQSVTVQFKLASPAQLGIGLDYASNVGSSSGIVPAGGSAVFSTAFNPTISGNACIQAVVTAAGASPISTESCLDVTESLKPGRTDTLTFPVRNNSSTDLATVLLVVDNTCPGWTASITNPVTGQFTNMGIGETRTATLSVTPPNGGLLGTLCHIDVQAWIGTTLIGGIRKIDVAPLHLPLNVTPAWEEQEITFNPDPPQAGAAGQICIQLVNPLASGQVVSIDFSVADFGAGISFTPAASLINLTIPPGVSTHCANWTPPVSGTLHRCVLATLTQSGYLDQHSQRNVEIVRPAAGSPSSLVIPFIAGNPDLIAHVLSFDTHLIGIDPGWMVVIEMLGGGVPPSTPLAPGGQLALQLHLVPTGTVLAPAGTVLPPMVDFRYGSQHSVEVNMLLDGQPAGGFSAMLGPNPILVPIIHR